MYLQQFGLKHDPLGKPNENLVDQAQYKALTTQLNWLLESRGVGIITGDVGVGKTTSIKRWSDSLNPHTHKVIYQADNHFKAFDIYRQLAESLGIEGHHRYSRLWRNLKEELLHRYETKKLNTVWILDECQLLPRNFFAELPAFLNFNFDSQNVITIILMGNEHLSVMVKRNIYAAMASRVAFHYRWKPMENFESFAAFILQAFENAGCSQNIMSETGLKLVHIATKGHLRYARRLITRCLQMGAQQNLNHIPDEIIKAAIEDLQSTMS
jgi:type II secretory pathway predicted ATPase ExeA